MLGFFVLSGLCFWIVVNAIYDTPFLQSWLAEPETVPGGIIINPAMLPPISGRGAESKTSQVFDILHMRRNRRANAGNSWYSFLHFMAHVLLKAIEPSLQNSNPVISFVPEFS
jgi:hypothetical protein